MLHKLCHLSWAGLLTWVSPLSRCGHGLVSTVGVYAAFAVFVVLLALVVVTFDAWLPLSTCLACCHPCQCMVVIVASYSRQ